MNGKIKLITMDFEHLFTYIYVELNKGLGIWESGIRYYPVLEASPPL